MYACRAMLARHLCRHSMHYLTFFLLLENCFLVTNMSSKQLHVSSSCAVNGKTSVDHVPCSCAAHIDNSSKCILQFASKLGECYGSKSHRALHCCAVLPGSILAMLLHWLPYSTNWSCRVASSASVQASRVMVGSKCLFQRPMHC